MVELTPQSEAALVAAAQQEAINNLIEEKNAAVRKMHEAHADYAEVAGKLLRWELLDSDMLRSFVTAVRAHCLFPNAPEAESLGDLLKRTELLHTRLEKLRV